MALNIPQSTPLTPSQSEVKAKVSSMKSLLSLPIVDFKNIPKSKQVSTFDYLVEILEVLGVSPDVLFQQFFSRVLDETSSELEDAIVEGAAKQLAASGTKLATPGSPAQTFNFQSATPQEKQAAEGANRIAIQQSLQSLGLTNFLQTAKQNIVKDLTLAIFGPKDGASSQYLNPDPNERERIINGAICAVDAFSLSNDGFIRDEDVEYNRIALAKQLEKGEVIFEISCQEIKIKLPEDPSFIFEGGGTQTIESQNVTPAQSIEILATYVQSTTQQINNEENATNAGKSFKFILVEKFLSNITNLVFPYVGGLIGAIQPTLPSGSVVSSASLVTNTCEILNGTSTDLNKKVFGETLVNQLYRILLQLLLSTALREFKKLTKNYFSRIATEKAKRKVEKIKARFSLVTDAAEQARKAAAYAQALGSLSSILQQT